jgi:hypothetical protein
MVEKIAEHGAREEASKASLSVRDESEPRLACGL